MVKKQREQDVVLRNILLGLAIVVIGFFAFYYISGSLRTFEYQGVEFEKIQEGQLTFYKTTFPMYRNGTKVADYNFYIRTNPQSLGNVSFNGNLSVRDMVVFNPSEELNCNGDGVIAVANIVQNLYTYLGAKAIRDENATCDTTGQKAYSLVIMKKGDATEINQIGDSCYEITVANCEVLPATERYMLEAFKKINEAMKS